MSDALIRAAALCLKLRGQPKSLAVLGAALLPNAADPAIALVEALADLGVTAGWRAGGALPDDVLPVVALLADGRIGVAVSQDAGQLEIRWPGVTTTEYVPLAFAEQVLLFTAQAAADGRADDLVAGSARGWFWPVLWAYRRYFQEAVALSVVINLLSLAGIIFMMTVYDRILPNQAYVTLWSLAVGVVLAMVFEFAARSLRGHVLDSAGKKIDLVLGDAVFAHVLGARLEFRARSSGAFANVLKEFEAVRAFATSASLTALADLPFALLFLVVTAVVGGPLVAVPLVAFLAVGVLSMAVQGALSRVADATLREGAVRHGTVIESLEGLETLKALRAEARMRRRHEVSSHAIAQGTVRSLSLSNLVLNLTVFIQQAAAALLLVWGVYLAGKGVVSAGALIACVQLNSRALAPLVSLSSLAVRYQQARSALASLNRIMAQPLDREPSRTYLSSDDWRGCVEIKAATFAYEPDLPPALSAVSLRIEPGERVAILGRIGSGKSTLLRLAGGLYRPQAGQVFFDGVEMSAIEPADVRATVILVGQDARLFHGSLVENLRLAAPGGADADLIASAQALGVGEIAADHPLGLERPVGERGDNLSGGQRQAVAIARAMLARPRLLLLDEPTAAMDQRTEAEVLQALVRGAEDGTGFVIVTHKQSILSVVDRVVVMDRGRIVADGPRDEVVRALSEGRVRAAA